ncbi:MAG: asparagine--tRNA ligase [Candidatus Kerfeldbacteria bacterium RIFCSPLOWO2_01_FULL_48_11]|uniref:Asparagine--tRNA ligase n=1 Tax=Candidatus Kerfeldbacteria bacterium RIFCSPLOWO2_01_FULL_48_11 TaxID=1798543 RepID=A0A1G2B5D3_9BACT|nr:MAG: Asparagine-tRNA ligase [Parcubacteria group bacterium GW2011_GWC2_49_9]OGY84398.1 MAG: asparagine--tRNA ligase [Candidatus Kerfeldbacteria bacterium RIFCSPLOWO2_01_FULL_48_11]HCJ52218.1 asparagine--tRNA ligase [Candidatus Kerfeldbacteria bacterium]
MQCIDVRKVDKFVGKTVCLQGWAYNFRSSGKIFFLQLRDGSGTIQAVVSKGDVSDEAFTQCETITLESSVRVTGTVKKEPRSPSGYELTVSDISVVYRAEAYPIAKKEHGTEFLFDHRHLWVRSSRQAAVLRIRDQVIWSLRSFLRERGFTLTDTPILTPTSCEGTTTLFETDYFGEKAYLAQSGQLYLEALAASLGKVYDFGPTFRAEKSKTRRHLMEFWMLDAEVAFMHHDESLELQEALIERVVQDALTQSAKELTLLERDVVHLKNVHAPFHRITYDDAVSLLKEKGSDITLGQDLGADDETKLSEEFDRPVFITHYPAAIKAFYMKPDPMNPTRALCADLIATEGYGEIIGGSERIDDLALLERRFKEHKLPRKPFEWYLDLRRYGSFPHSGFGIGLERVVTWIAGLPHVREAIPFPRLLNRLQP